MSVSRRAFLQAAAIRAHPLRDIRLEHCDFQNVANPNVVEHVEGLKLGAVTINGKKADV